jgi:hypothetical protein
MSRAIAPAENTHVDAEELAKRGRNSASPDRGLSMRN